MDRPTMLDLIGEVRGQRVLDADCGAGRYVTALHQQGATVLGLEASLALKSTRGPESGCAEIRQHDLDEPLDFVEHGPFDGVVCALVLHHLLDRPSFFREVARVLRPAAGWRCRHTSEHGLATLRRLLLFHPVG